jgi:hypothetical protein
VKQISKISNTFGIPVHEVLAQSGYNNSEKYPKFSNDKKQTWRNPQIGIYGNDFYR